MQETVLVTGCSGFIGSHVSERALSEGYRVIGMDVKDCKNPEVEFIKGSITDRLSVEKAVSEADYIIHLAAITSNIEFEKDYERAHEVNVNGFLNVINAAAKSKCKKFLYASSSAVYPEESQFSEDFIINIKRQRNHYAKSKLINEMYAESYRDIYKLPTVGMRFFNVYGPGENEKGDYASIITIFKSYKEMGKKLVIYGDGSQARDFIYVKDVAEIVLKLLKKAESGVYNVGTGTATSYLKIAELIDPLNKEHIPNPLSSYQRLTRADTGKLEEAIGEYKFTELENLLPGF